MKPRAGIQRLIKLRDQLHVEVAKHQTDIDVLKIKIETFDRAIAELRKADPSADGDPLSVTPSRRKKAPRKGRAARGNVKAMLEEFLKEVGGKGLNAAIAVQMAEARGQPLDRGTISSLLSRWKTDGAVIYEGDKYRLKDLAAVPLVASLQTPQGSSAKAA